MCAFNRRLSCSSESPSLVYVSLTELLSSSSSSEQVSNNSNFNGSDKLSSILRFLVVHVR